MDWVDYVKSELAKNNSLSELKITFGDDANECVSTPPIIKVSIDLLNRFFEADEKRVIMVFPEKRQSIFFLAVLKVIHDIFDGKSEKIYNPNTFIKGQKLKCGNCVVEFDRIDQFRGTTTLWVKDADCSNGIPLDLAPFFQLTDTNRCLSTDKVFSKTKVEIKKRKAEISDSDHLTTILIDYKTHFNNTVFNVAPTGKVKEMMSDICINGIKVEDLLLIGQADTEGNVENINRGQLSGEPAIVVTSDMYAVYEATKKESDVKCLFVDISNPNTINNELDVLDELLNEDFPIICLTDTLNSFELESLELRGFCIWRWDEESIAPDMYNVSTLCINKKVGNCAVQKIQYLKCDSEEISNCLGKLYYYRKEVALTNVNMIDVYDKLFSLAFLCLRNIVDLKDIEYTRINENILNCKVKLQNEKRFISDELFNNLENVISSFEVVYSKEYVIPKISALKEVLLDNHYKNVCIVIPDRADKEKHQVFWNKVCTEKKLETKVSVLSQAEYCNSEVIACDITIVCGWLSSTIMRRIIYSYNTSKYIVLLYAYEERWKNAHIKSWNSILHKCNSRKVIEKVFAEANIDLPYFKDETLTMPTGQENHDELSEIEMVLRENKYRKYLANGGNKNINEVVESVPVNFVGGCFAFYRSTHKLVSVTKIVLEEKDNIKIILPIELKIGDFIVVRESQHDLIKDYADIILSNSGKSGRREFATKWKEALKLESVFSTFDDIYLKLKKAGCTKNQFTVRQWMKNEDVISPQNINDLKYIAEATEDNVLLEQLESIFEAGMEVKRAHVQAGRTLSELLKRKVAQKIQEIGEIDPYNIWEPITLYLDEIGTVKILKVIDIGTVLVVDASTTNTLISE
ncbi:DrmE family protein [Clostridium bowmanii]|uniref:DrmE family protein n=1 Tax=Clostridium bowmanii TaxID=132925 RepID=UPI001C0C8DA3|nr:DrmE family protein [Clostridium bowmanii]MBU3188332.1 DrmE family protein [Clostridium bowmanii]MCA1072720.1 DrmE family protein [Clostridium bowmanii]